MVTWLEPLRLQTFFMNILAGDPTYFVVISLIVISAVAGFFRMTTLTLFFFLGLFLLMFSGFAMDYLTVLFAIIAGLMIGYVLSKIYKSPLV